MVNVNNNNFYNFINFMSRRICILHDTFIYRGGGERLIFMMAEALGADIASGFFDPGSFDLRAAGFT